ncbi:hypothetical protein AB0E88_00080 [Streptomyces sp. NPDC028635]|uniref:hypothetical protein n=1 Tax=Streptomyces sp. NPDC028635 TaxID=3154800 RepID=UPI0033CEE471
MLALVGLGVAVAIGLRQVVVIAPLACFGSAWLIRIWLAGHMEADQQVQLFPRTMMQIQVTLTALAVLACVLAVRKLAPHVTATVGAAQRGRRPARCPAWSPASRARTSFPWSLSGATA